MNTLMGLIWFILAVILVLIIWVFFLVLWVIGTVLIWLDPEEDDPGG